MWRLSIIVGLFVLLVGLSASPASAASDAYLVTVEPNILVNKGRGFVKNSSLMPVKAGDQVMANEDGSGWIIYCGCDVEVEPGKVYTVEQRECKVESVDLSLESLPHVVIEPDRLRKSQDIRRCRGGIFGDGSGAPGGLSSGLLLGGLGVGVGVGACALAGCFDDDDDDRRRSASP